MKKLLAVLSLLAVSTVSYAESESGKHSAFVDGNMLYGFLQSDNKYEQRLGQGFVVGVADYASSLKLACLPKGVTPGQLADIVKKYYEDEPTSRHQGAGAQIGVFFMVTFPCKDTPK